MNTRKYESPLGRDIGTSKATKGRGWKGLKGQMALALAVSLWIGGSGMAMAQETTIAENYDGNVSGNHDDNGWNNTNGDPNNNQVTVNEGVTVKGKIYGSNKYATTVSGNTVIINGAVKRDVYGGYSGGDTALSSDVHSNHVTINGSVDGGVYGGWCNAEGNAHENEVIVNGGTVGGSIYGGYVSYADTASEALNQVTLKNAKVTGNVYGFYPGDGNGRSDVINNNTLNLYGANTVGGNVGNFEKITLDKDLVWNTTSPVLTAGNFSNFGGLDITAATNLTAATTLGTMTLLQGTSGNFNTLNLTYKNGTTTATAALGGTKPTSQVVKTVTGGSSVDKGVTLGYDTTHTVSIADTSKVTYTVANYANKITLGTITWNKNGTARALTAGDYTFNDSTAIDTSSFEFNTPSYIGAGESMTLIGNATGLTAGDSIAHSQSYTNYDNCIKLNATLTGNITRTTNTLGYTATGTTLDSVDLANWNGTTTAVPADWGSNLRANSIKAAGFAAPDVAAGESTNILTTTINNFFNDNQITGAMKYKADAASSDTTNGVTLTGAELKGVKASDDGKSLVYERSNFNISGISLGEMTWGTGREATTGCDFNNVTDANISVTNLKFANPENIAKDATMTLLSGATNLKAGTDIAHTQDFTKTVNSTTLSATLSGNVTRTAETLGYTATGTTLNKATLGSFAWGAEADSLPEGWTASAATTIDATNFEYTGKAGGDVAAGTTSTILNAPGLTEASPVTGGANIEVAVDYTDDKGIKFEATATGDVEAVANTVQYCVNSVALKNVDLGGWDGTVSGVPQNWTGSQVAVETGNFNVPTNLAAGQSIDILTTAKANFFGTVSGDRKYSSETFGNSEAGVTLSGHHIGGVKVEAYGEKANAKLTYYAETMDTTAIALGEMTWGVSRDGSGAGNNYARAAIDAGGLQFASWKPEETAANASTILLLGNDTLPDFTAVSKNYSYSVAPISGVTVDGVLNGSVSKSGNNIVYTATEHKASKLTFGTVNWLSDGALIDHATTLSNMSFANADVDTTNIRFQNLQTAASEDKMTLVSSFGLSIGTVTGTEFSVGKGKGEGHAYLESNDLKYVVTKGVDFNPTGDDNAINEAGDPVVGEIARDVIGGVAQNKGVAENNTMIVSPDSNVTGSVTAAISEKGASENNEAKVTDANVSGSVTGAEVNGSGTAAGNKATVENTNVGDVQNHTGDVIGAKTDSGLATGNIADVTGGTVEGNVIGARSTSGTVSTGNEANISGANVGGDVYGGVSTDGEANANQAELSNGAVVNGDVYGGKSENKTATSNNVTIENATVDGDVYGGKSKAVSQNNKVDFNGGTVKNLIGGGCETATGNTVTVESGTVKESVYGGKAEVDALENHVILSGGTVTEAIYGGWSNSISGKTQGNSVLLYGVADVHTANIFGGNREATGNTLTIGLSSGNTYTPWTGGEQTVRNINNFETISFAVVPWSESKAAVAITDGTASDLSMSKVDAKKVHFTNVDSLKQRDSMTLLDQSKAAKKATTVEEKSEFTIGTGVQGKGYLSIDKESGNVLYTVGEMGASDQSHNTVMGAEAGMAALSAGNDFVGSAVEGLGDSNNAGSDGLATYAKMGGDSMKVETGSHVKTRTWNAILALGHKNEKKLSTTEYGAFFEYGTGNYSTFNGDERGDGSTRYTGGGILGKWQKNNGFYVEGSLRAGSIRDDAFNVLRDYERNPYSYNTDATYWGAHIGVGKELKVNKTDLLDLYAKYFYNHRGSVSFDAKGHYDLDAVESSVLRIGTRYTVKKNDNFKFYGGIAVEHEFAGRASGTATPEGGTPLSIRGADIGGTSVRGEIGATFRPGEKSNVTLDLYLSGFVGKKQGFTGGLSAVFRI